MILDTFTYLFKPEGQEKVKEAMQQLSDFFGQKAEAQKVQLDNLMGIVAPFIAAYGTLRTIMSFSEENEQLYTMNNLTGIAAQSFKELGIATEQFGGGLTSSMGTLSRLQQMITQTKWTGSSAITAAAEKYGLAFSDKPEQLLRNIAKRMETMNKQQQLDFGRMLGLDNPTIQLLQKGLKGVNDELERAKDLNFLDDETIESSHLLVKDIREMVMLFKEASQLMSIEFHPQLHAVVRWIKDAMIYLGKHKDVLQDIAGIVLTIGGAFAAWKLAQMITSAKGLFVIMTGLSLAAREDWRKWKKGTQNTGLTRIFGNYKDRKAEIDAIIKSINDFFVTEWNKLFLSSPWLQKMYGWHKLIGAIWDNKDLPFKKKIQMIFWAIGEAIKDSWTILKGHLKKVSLFSYLFGKAEDIEKDSKQVGWLESIQKHWETMIDDFWKWLEPKLSKLNEDILTKLGAPDVIAKGENPWTTFFQEGFENMWEDIWTELKATELYKWIEGLVEKVKKAMGDFVKPGENGKSPFDEFKEGVQSELKGIMTAIFEGAFGAASFIKTAIATLTDIIINVFVNTKDFLEALFTQIAKKMGGAFGEGILPGMWKNLSEFGKSLAYSLVLALNETLKGVGLDFLSDLDKSKMETFLDKRQEENTKEPARIQNSDTIGIGQDVINKAGKFTNTVGVNTPADVQNAINNRNSEITNNVVINVNSVEEANKAYDHIQTNSFVDNLYGVSSGGM